MGEPAAAEAATSERDVLLATKLNVPGLRPGLVPRSRLALGLDEGPGRGLVLVCAPAGYGKTVPLADWVRRGHAVAALDRVRPGISEQVSALLGPPAPLSFEPLVTALINEVAASRTQTRSCCWSGRLSRDQLAAGTRVARVPA